MNIKIFATIMALVIVASIGLNFVAGAADPVIVKYVKINGDTYEDGDTLVVKRGDTLDIRVKLSANETTEDLQVEASIYGYKYGENERELVSDVTETFDMEAGDTVYKDLTVHIPIEMDKKYTKLRVLVSDENGFATVYNYQLRVKGIDRDESVIIQDFAVSPSNVLAGYGVTGLVKVKNIGEEDFDFLKVTMSIPELGIDSTEYLDSLEADESATFSELELLIPECTPVGTYSVKVAVDYDKYGHVEKESTIRVTDNPYCKEEEEEEEGKTSIVVPGKEGIIAGEETALPIIITNEGKNTKTYSLTIIDGDWATVRFEPGSAFVVRGGESKTIYAYITPQVGVTGDKALTIRVDDGTQSEDVVIMVNVAKPAKSGLEIAKIVLEIVLIVLIVALVVVGIVLAAKKKRGEEEEE